MKSYVTYLMIAAFALAAVFTACKKDKKNPPQDDKEGVVINGVRWATCNVDMPGTFAKNPEDAGMFYQWNRKVGWSSTDPMINSDGGTTWDDSLPLGDIWNPENDPCPCGWRVPTGEEWWSAYVSRSCWQKELNGVSGCFWGSGENSIFFPAAGYRNGADGMLKFAGLPGGYYYGNSDDNQGYCIDVEGSFVADKSAGFSLRCVKK